MALKLMYITNQPEVALIAEKYGVDRIWVDLETLGKNERQKNMDTVKSEHTVEDIRILKPILKKAELLVRINPWNCNSKEEIENVIRAGADLIMLPMWKTADEVKSFIDTVGGRKKTVLLLETKEAVECIDEVLQISGIGEVHIGLNDLHLSYGMAFMFEPLADGTVEWLCKLFREAGLPYGFGGIAKIGTGMLPAEKIIMEHYRLGSTRAILSRAFCDTRIIESVEEIEKVFAINMEKLRSYERYISQAGMEAYLENKEEVIRCVAEISKKIKEDMACKK